jgi:hypothetical protein
MIADLADLVSDRLKAPSAEIAEFYQRWKITEVTSFTG